MNKLIVGRSAIKTYTVHRTHNWKTNFVGISTLYLQLNSKDAALFVYKKTLFELNNDYRKEFKLNSYSKIIYLAI